MERELVEWLRSRLPPASTEVALGPGDDAAVLAPSGDRGLVVTTDMLMDGVDFRLDELDPRRAGRKSLAVNLSDLAAMAAQPTAAFVSLALPRSGAAGLDALELAKRLYEGLLPLADEFGVVIAGGDTNTWDGPLVVSVTAVGKTTARGPLLRSGARPGDALVVTGSFGGSILGKHLDFTPRVREALLLHELYGVHAAMDVSDGLSLDLSRLCAESGCGAFVRSWEIPVDDAADRLAETKPGGGDAISHALGDGEDFELLLAMPFDDAERAVKDRAIGDVPLTIIGGFVTERGLWDVDPKGRRKPLAPRGYLHGADS